MYLYETHCHTGKISACATNTAQDIVDVFTANGYTGVFITDHFLNGNTTVHRLIPGAGYEEKIELFCKGYEEVKELAEGKLDVFFGFEYSYLGTDILTYGWDKAALKKLPKILDMSMRDFVLFAKDNGAIAIQAHPFREDFYIDHIRLYPDCEGVEVMNAGRNELCNSLGKFYAESYGKIMTGGSDIHHRSQKKLSGMAFDERIKDEKHFLELLREKKGKVVTLENVLA